MKMWLKISAWILLLTGVGLIFYLANKFDEHKIIDSPNVAIHYEGENAMLTEKELLHRLREKQLIFSDQRVMELDINSIEEAINNMPEVKNAHVFRAIGSTWNIELELRKPIARIFNQSGQSFYLDAEGFLMNRSELHTARTLVFSGNIKDKFQEGNINQIINNDSLKSIKKLDDIYRISNYVCNDPLLYHLISQVHIDENGDFIMIPIVGEALIVFGKADSERSVADKFDRLKVFYQQGLPFEGWNKYAEINLSYDGQIVCRKRYEQPAN